MTEEPINNRTRLDAEYSQWLLTNNLLNYMITNYYHYKFAIYEFHNIMERFLMSMCNSPLKSRMAKPWTVYYHLTRTDPFVKQMYTELVQKCGVGKCAADIIEHVVFTINHTVSQQLPAYTSQGIIKIFRRRLSYRTFMIDLQPSQVAKLKRYNRWTMMIMVIRYSTIIIKSQQWSAPSTLFKVLYDNYNVRFEGYASPLNNGIGDFKNAEYCSLFDIDKQFGSIGNIYNVDMASPFDDIKLDSVGWIVHPPYVLQTMLDAFKKICQGLENAKLKGINLFVIFIIPYWSDSEIYRQIKRTHFKYTEIIMTRHTHFYENHGRFINSSSDTSVFIFDGDCCDIRKYSDIISAMYIKNIPDKPNIPKPLRNLIDMNNYQKISITDKDDETNVVVLNQKSLNQTTWKSKYTVNHENYVIRNKDISPIIVKTI
jgi:hypothetical protein